MNPEFFILNTKAQLAGYKIFQEIARLVPVLPCLFSTPEFGTWFCGRDSGVVFYSESKTEEDEYHGKMLLHCIPIKQFQQYHQSCDGMEYFSRVFSFLDDDRLDIEALKRGLEARRYLNGHYFPDGFKAILKACQAIFNFNLVYRESPEFKTYQEESGANINCTPSENIPVFKPGSELRKLKLEAENAIQKFIDGYKYLFHYREKRYVNPNDGLLD